ncbi:hypothetical protein C8F04DRAFT_1146698 [Mycena alexandri]|uniref:DUF7587 domain-containing protein n=1 Tax=Mycena alexandri TaxID=1745969 RepID=A0AAD6S4H5_9AGAR|nr:hypothetical protein C8F04DRAFT_1146698 [Mycena alexandri]
MTTFNSDAIPLTIEFDADENPFLLRVHRKDGHGELSSLGFFASTHSTIPYNAPGSAHYPGSSGRELERRASAHVTQWKNRTWDQPSCFISLARSIPYVLFESRRRDLLHPANQPRISVIDGAKLVARSDAWLATDLVGHIPRDPVFFAQRADEVLAYSWIHRDAVVATVPVDKFFDCLPPWCGQVKADIRGDRLWSTADVANALETLARQHCNTAAAEEELLEHSVQQSIEILRRENLASSMEGFDENRHAGAIDKIAGLASIFCWWPKWIVGDDDAEYPALLEAVRNRVVQKLRWEKFGAEMTSMIQTSVLASAIRSRVTSHRMRTTTPYARPN